MLSPSLCNCNCNCMLSLCFSVFKFASELKTVILWS